MVSGALAQYKGSGAVNGSGDYGFILTATDGQVTGGGGVDKFRIKIWNKAIGGVVYDNGVGLSDNINSANPQAIGGGTIEIQKATKIARLRREAPAARCRARTVYSVALGICYPAGRADGWFPPHPDPLPQGEGTGVEASCCSTPLRQDPRRNLGNTGVRRESVRFTIQRFNVSTRFAIRIPQFRLDEQIDAD